MHNHVSKEKIDMTTRCKCDFKCLHDDSFQVCPVENPITPQGVYFIKMVHSICNSSYCLSFGNSYICRCPVRKELYERYKV